MAWWPRGSHGATARAIAEAERATWNLVGPTVPWMVDRDPVLGGFSAFCARRGPRVCQPGRSPGRLHDVLYRLSLFYRRRISPISRVGGLGAAEGVPHGWGRVLFFGPRQIDWWASGIQLIGTVFFNVSTANAVRIDLSISAASHHIWRPDALGSVCFLVASGLAWFEVCHGWGSWSPRNLSWWITLLNLVGSVAFGISAVAAYIVPATGQLWNVELTNLGTFVGALCFLAGAILLLPERTLASGAY